MSRFADTLSKTHRPVTHEYKYEDWIYSKLLYPEDRDNFSKTLANQPTTV